MIIFFADKLVKFTLTITRRWGEWIKKKNAIAEIMDIIRKYDFNGASVESVPRAVKYKFSTEAKLKD